MAIVALLTACTALLASPAAAGISGPAAHPHHGGGGHHHHGDHQKTTTTTTSTTSTTGSFTNSASARSSSRVGPHGDMSAEEHEALIQRVESRIRHTLLTSGHTKKNIFPGVHVPEFEADSSGSGLGVSNSEDEETDTSLEAVMRRAERDLKSVVEQPDPASAPEPDTAFPPNTALSPDSPSSIDTDSDGKDVETTTLLLLGDEEVACIAEVTVREVVAKQDATVHAVAMAEAFQEACDQGDNVTVSDFDAVFLSEDAFAFAATMSSVMLECQGLTEDAYKCVSVTATASAYAEATAAAHAEAVSLAVDACGCLTEAVADGIASTDTYVKLVAEAASSATAEVCVEGTELVTAWAFDECISVVYGQVFATAVGEAIVEGDCQSADAIAEVLAETEVSYDAESTCGLEATAFLFDPAAPMPAPARNGRMDAPSIQVRVSDAVGQEMAKTPVSVDMPAVKRAAKGGKKKKSSRCRRHGGGSNAPAPA